MRPVSLLLLRASTGMLLVLWGLLRVRSPESGQGLAEKYYNGLLNDATLQFALGGAEIVLGLLIALGLLRVIVYPVQALVLGVGLAFIWKHILDPFGLYLFGEGESANLLFFPSTTVFFATLILIAFRDYDRLALDNLFGRR